MPPNRLHGAHWLPRGCKSPCCTTGKSRQCDCRRVLLQVISPQFPDEILATINYGWESAEFYNRKLPWVENAGRDITSASLDPLNPNSKLAGALLEEFRQHLRRETSYPQRLKRHYELFKRPRKKQRGE